MKVFMSFLLLLFSTNGVCQALAHQYPDDDWHYAVSFPMVWAPSINANIAYDAGENINVDVSFEEIMQKLNFGIMGGVTANKGNWGYGFTTNYLRTKSNAYYDPDSILVPPHYVDSTLHVATSDLTVRYRVHSSIRLMTGVRHFWTKLTLDINPADAGLIEIDKKLQAIDQHTFDWIAGAAFDHWFTAKWGLSFTLDASLLGANDVDTNIAGYAIYKTDQLNNLWLGYRRLQIGNNFTSDGKKGTATFTESGPVVGWTFTF